MRSDTIITTLDRDLIRTDTRRCVLVRVSRTDATCCDGCDCAHNCVSMRNKEYLITFLISEDIRTFTMEGAEHNEKCNICKLLMYAYDKSYASPFYPCLCCSFLASFRFLINTENDRIGVYFSIVDQRIKLIYLARMIIRNRS